MNGVSFPCIFQFVRYHKMVFIFYSFFLCVGFFDTLVDHERRARRLFLGSNDLNIDDMIPQGSVL